MFDKNTEKAILAVIKEIYTRENYGIFAPRKEYCSPRDRYELHCKKINIDENFVYQDGVKVAKIIYKYSERRVNLAYKITGARLEYLNS